MRFANLQTLIEVTRDSLLAQHKLVSTEQWQSRPTNGNPALQTYELLNHYVTTSFVPVTPEELAAQVGPNLPWAEEHFLERISGQPLNPPPSWERWPFASSAASFRKDKKFSHTYPERMWPTFHPNGRVRKGVRFTYGDFNNVIELLARQPGTRQAYLPIWFPEDTGVVHGERVPCTLGYWFIIRNGLLHLSYFIRSCDFYHHFRDDVYLTIRLQQHVMGRLLNLDQPHLNQLGIGSFSMWIGSLHLFVNDRRKLLEQDK